jgi:hypothetical protein
MSQVRYQPAANSHHEHGRLPIDGKGLPARKIHRREQHQRVHTPERDEGPARASMPSNPASMSMARSRHPVGTKCAGDRELALTVRRAHQQERGHVHAEQEQDAGRTRHRQWRPNRVEQIGLERNPLQTGGEAWIAAPRPEKYATASSDAPHPRCARARRSWLVQHSVHDSGMRPSVAPGRADCQPWPDLLASHGPATQTASHCEIRSKTRFSVMS